MRALGLRWMELSAVHTLYLRHCPRLPAQLSSRRHRLLCAPARRKRVADGSLHDACLLAVLAALSCLRLHAVTVDEGGQVVRTALLPGGPLRQLQLGCQPVSLTCGVCLGRLVLDPTAEEEALAEALLTVTLDEHGAVRGEGVDGGRYVGGHLPVCGWRL